MELMNINEAIRTGCVARAFLSGGGLRVIRIEDANQELKGYGEHPHIDEALRHADEDYAAGGRPYDEVYGGSKTHYLTGSTTPNSELDAWIRQGSKFRATSKDDVVTFELLGYDDDFNEIKKVGTGTNFWEAQTAAFAAEAERL